MPEPETDSLVRVLASDECPMGTPQEPELRLVDVGDVQVIVTRLADSGEVVAFASTCPHQGTDLMDASFFDGQLRCPYHLYLYDPRTGENRVPARDAKPENLWKLKPGYLPVHRVLERDGWIWVAPTPCPPPAAYDPAREQRPTDAELAERRSRAAATTAPPPPTAVGPVEHPAKTVRVRPGTTFELRLPVDAKPGHMWRIQVVDGPVTLVEDGYDAAADPPRHLVRLSAPSEGVTTVRCTFARPWDAVPAEVRTYVVRVSDPAGG